MFSGPLYNPANQAPGVQTGHALGVISSHRLIMEKKLLLWNHEAHSLYIEYVAMCSGPLHKSDQSSPWALNWPRPYMYI